MIGKKYPRNPRNWRFGTNLNCIKLDFQVLNLQIYAIYFIWSKNLDLKIHGGGCFPTCNFQLIFVNKRFFSTKIHHSSNSHVTSRTLTSRCSWTMRLVKVGHSKGGFLVPKLEGDTTVVEVVLPWCWNVFNFSSMKKMIESPSFQIGGVAWRMIIFRCFQPLGIFWEESFSSNWNHYLPSKCFRVVANHRSNHRSIGRKPRTQNLPVRFRNQRCYCQCYLAAQPFSWVNQKKSLNTWEMARWYTTVGSTYMFYTLLQRVLWKLNVHLMQCFCLLCLVFLSFLAWSRRSY